MRILLSTISLFLVLGTSYATHPELVQIRSAFVAATQDLSAREALVDVVSQAQIGEEYRLAYLGASKTLLAECGYSPWTKWNHFQDGKALLEKAIDQAPSNAEFRYLRFLIQFSAPAFLDYNDHLADDYHFVEQYMKNASSDEVWITYFKSFSTQHAAEINERIRSNS